MRTCPCCPHTCGHAPAALQRAAKRRKLLEAHSQELQHISQGGSYELSGAASSSSSSAQDGSSRYSLRRKEITEAAATVFADAAEEFGSLRAVKQRLEQFKFRWGAGPGFGAVVLAGNHGSTWMVALLWSSVAVLLFKELREQECS
jgi:hypothetical protein